MSDKEAAATVTQGLRELLGSSDAAELFWREKYQRHPHIFRRSDRDRPGRGQAAVPRWPPIELSDMEEMWTSAMKFGDPNAVLTFRDGKQLDVKTPFFAYPHDCSVVVNKADRFSRAVLDLCSSLEDTFPFVFCNVYLTPPGSQTVRFHSDDREVLAVQVLGRKNWRVFADPPTKNPYREEEVGKRNPFDPEGKTVALEDQVSPGDVLYLPRGHVHGAWTTDDEPSLHLTLAIQTSDWDMGAMLRDGIGEVIRRREAATTREVIAPRALATAAADRDGDASDDFVGDVAAGSTAAFKAALEEAVAALTLETCATAWRDRMAVMRSDRATALNDSLRPVLHPVTLETNVLWNADVTVVAMEEVQDAPVSSVKFVGVLRRDEGQTMPLHLSPATKNVIAMMTSRHKKLPAAVLQLPLPCPLARLTVANWLLRNGCLVRVD